MPDLPDLPLPQSSDLPVDLVSDIGAAGYYPDVVCDAAAFGLVGEKIVAHLVHQDTTFDAADILRRHVTVLILTPTRVLVVHAHDHTDDNPTGMPVAATSVESVPLSRLQSVVLTRVVTEPDTYVRGQLAHEATVTLCWGTVRRIDLEPSTCGDPNCNAEHGLTGTSTADDTVVRVSSVADGMDAVNRAIAFAHATNMALGPHSAR